MKTLKILVTLILILQSAYLKAANSNDPSITETNPFYSEDKRTEESEKIKTEEKRVLRRESAELEALSNSAEKLLITYVVLLAYTTQEDANPQETINGLKTIYALSSIIYSSAEGIVFTSPSLKSTFTQYLDAVALIKESSASLLNSFLLLAENRKADSMFFINKGMSELKEAKEKIEKAKTVLTSY